jgi:hypothetical protein
VKEAEGLGDGEELLVADTFADGDVVGVAVADAFAVLPAAAEREADAPGEGVNIEGWVDPELVHPAAPTDTRSTKVTAPAAGVARTFMKPPAFGIDVDYGTENLWSMPNGVFSF